jgi:hypothetical protein
MAVLHVVGLVGAGKTTAIRRFFPTCVEMDIQDVYRLNDFQPDDIKSPENYAKFEAALKGHFENYLAEVTRLNQPLLIIESSGINQALNRLLAPYSPFIVWIVPDFARIGDPAFLKRRRYAEGLNQVIWTKFNQRKLVVHATYDTATGEFTGDLPAWLAPFVHHPATAPRNHPPNSENVRCPGCGAEFSKPAYLELHYKRSPACQLPH